MPSDLDLSPWAGATLINVGVGQFITNFTFFQMAALDYAEVGAEGRWELVDGDLNVVGGRGRGADPVSLPFERVLGAQITEFRVAAPTHFELTLSSGLTLRFYDDSEQYESFSIQPGNYFI